MDIGQQDNCSNSFLYFFIRLHGQAVKTPPFHGGIRGSNPLGVIEQNIKGNSNCRLGSMAEQLICNQQVVGSTPTVGFLDLQLSWLEQPAHNRSVLGSSPRRSTCSTRYGLVAQLVRAPPCHGGGRGFESHSGRLCARRICRHGGTGRRTGLKILRDLYSHTGSIPVAGTKHESVQEVRVAQLDRASGYGPEGREFESCHVHLFNLADMQGFFII